MHAVNIIVIGYQLGKLETACLSSIINHTAFPYILTYYDNFKNDYTLTQIWNKLIAASPCNYVCLLNNDTKVYDEWLTKLVEGLEHISDCGFIGPSTNNCHSPQKDINTPEKALEKNGSIIKMDQPISGFCVLFKKETWEKLNGFDERYELYGQESDFIDRAKTQLGLYCYWRQDTFVYHVGEASVQISGIDKIAARNKAKKLYWSTRQ